jgi:hypothetical protein
MTSTARDDRSVTNDSQAEVAAPAATSGGALTHRGDTRAAHPIQGATLGAGVIRRMPGDFRIAVRPGTGSDTLRAGRERGERRQPMHGFEDTYVDIVDYIVRITHRIWEDQDIGYVYDTYSPGCVVNDDSGPNYGVERVVEGTIASIHAFPDTRSWADEVIWAGDDQQGFVTSHRYVTTGHHLGAWQWGPPTGRKVNLWGIANCVVRENEIFEEWVLYNMAAKLLQLGVDPVQAARRYGNELNASGRERHVGEVQRLEGGRQPEYWPAAGGPDFDVERFVRALWHNVYNRRDLSAVDRAYEPTARWRGTTNRLGYGRQDIKGQARSLLATFPDLGMQVDEVYWMGNAAEGFRVSVRWSAQGTHRGYALYGEPTARRVRLWGINQLYIGMAGGVPQITEDWMCFNEFDVMAQILSDEPADLFG